MKKLIIFALFAIVFVQAQEEAAEDPAGGDGEEPKEEECEEAWEYLEFLKGEIK